MGVLPEPPTMRRFLWEFVRPWRRHTRLARFVAWLSLISIVFCLSGMFWPSDPTGSVLVGIGVLLLIPNSILTVISWARDARVYHRERKRIALAAMVQTGVVDINQLSHEQQDDVRCELLWQRNYREGKGQ